jgi:hypothetical protein
MAVSIILVSAAMIIATYPRCSGCVGVGREVTPFPPLFSSLSFSAISERARLVLAGYECY